MAALDLSVTDEDVERWVREINNALSERARDPTTMDRFMVVMKECELRYYHFSSPHF